jgi:hypothetical protein
VTKAKHKKKQPAAQEPMINAFAAQHGAYREATVVDLSGELGGGRQKMIKVLRNLYPNVADRWLAEGGEGFDEPQRHAIEHCRALWASIGGQGKLVASWGSTGSGGKHCRAQMWTHAEALTQIALYQKRIPPAYWRAFENVVRFDMAAGKAGSHLANTSSQQQAHAKAATGFVASLIAMWKGF